MCLLDAAGVGVSHCLGVGGRDLSAQVGGLATVQALAALDADPATDVIVLVSKPPAAEVAEAIRHVAAGLSTPVVLALLGPGQDDLTAATARAVAAAGGQVPGWPSWLPAGQQAGQPTERPTARQGSLRGLFCGGTLCDEAMLIASGPLGPIASNIPLDPAWALPADLRADGHLMIDFGDDALTRGRAHPMIDGSLRLDRFRVEAADPSVGVLLVDVVLGYGSDPDPATALAGAVTDAVAGGRAVVVSLCGAAGDPQDLERQARTLQAAGASVFASNAEATRFAVGLVEGSDR